MKNTKKNKILFVGVDFSNISKETRDKYSEDLIDSIKIGKSFSNVHMIVYDCKLIDSKNIILIEV